jgi:hypothetical protein
MSQPTLLWFFLILAMNIVRKRRTPTALMQDAMSYAIQAAVHLVTSTCPSNASVEKKRRECPVKSLTRLTSPVRTNVENYSTV